MYFDIFALSFLLIKILQNLNSCFLSFTITKFITKNYIEAAAFSLRFAAIFKKLGGRQASFLIHTLRNYKTQDRMAAIFDAVKEIGKQFIETAEKRDIQLRYFGREVHSSYALSGLINAAEEVTRGNVFKLNFLTNYSEIWAVKNMDAIEMLPEITVIGRFTKGHYSGQVFQEKHVRQISATFSKLQ